MINYLSKDLLEDVRVVKREDLNEEDEFTGISGFSDEHLKLIYDSLDSFYIPKGGDMINTRVIGKTKTDIIVEMNGKQSAYMSLKKEPTRLTEKIEIGDMVDVMVLEADSKSATKKESEPIEVSMELAELQTTYNNMRTAISEEDNTAYLGTIKDMIDNGGYIINVAGVDCFMPGSHAGINKLYDFASIIGDEVYVIPINYVRSRDMIVVSHKKFLELQKPLALETLRDNMSEQKTGSVTGTTKFGIFCEFDDCLTGMIHKSEFTDELRERHSNSLVKPGESIDFYIKEIISEKKIILSLEKYENPWDNIEEKYPITSNVEVTVTSIKNYGAFIKFEEGVFGLVPIKELTSKKVNEGDKIEVTITGIDKGSKKIFTTFR